LRVAPRRLFLGARSPFTGAFVSGAQPRRWCACGEAEASIALASENRLVARVPKARTASGARRHGSHESQPHPVHIGLQNRGQPSSVANPAVDLDGTFTSRFPDAGQRVPVSLYKITANYSVKPFITL